MLTRKGENASPSNWLKGTAFELTAIECYRLLHMVMSLTRTRRAELPFLLGGRDLAEHVVVEVALVVLVGHVDAVELV